MSMAVRCRPLRPCRTHGSRLSSRLQSSPRSLSRSSSDWRSNATGGLRTGSGVLMEGQPESKWGHGQSPSTISSCAYAVLLQRQIS